MWPLILQFVRANAAYITLPIAAIVGVIGYNIENLISDKYTPYSSKQFLILKKNKTPINNK